MHGLHEWVQMEQRTATLRYRADNWPTKDYKRPDPEQPEVQWIDLRAELEQLHSNE